MSETAEGAVFDTGELKRAEADGVEFVARDAGVLGRVVEAVAVRLGDVR